MKPYYKLIDKRNIINYNYLLETKNNDACTWNHIIRVDKRKKFNYNYLLETKNSDGRTWYHYEYWEEKYRM